MKTKLTMYGIKNCDTIKKARQWLEATQINYRFHDYRIDGIDGSLLEQFITQLGWQPLLNTRGTTWRKLPEAQRELIDNAQAAIQLMLEQPAVIKRPLLVVGQHMLLGFTAETYRQFVELENS